MFLASALKRGIHPPETLNSNMFPGDDSLSFKALAYLLRIRQTGKIPYAEIN
jgi:hypothetical protein